MYDMMTTLRNGNPPTVQGVNRAIDVISRGLEKVDVYGSGIHVRYREDAPFTDSNAQSTSTNLAAARVDKGSDTMDIFQGYFGSGVGRGDRIYSLGHEVTHTTYHLGDEMKGPHLPGGQMLEYHGVPVVGVEYYYGTRGVQSAYSRGITINDTLVCDTGLC
jgi:hypothetical protein